MAQKRRAYTPEFKLEAVRLLENSKLTVSEVARDLDIDPGRLRAWRRDFKESGKNAFPGHGRISDAEAENQRLRKELSQVKKERDFLKKAATFFAKESE